MTTEQNKSFAEKNEERVKKAVNEISDTLTDDEKKTQELKTKDAQK